MTGVFKVQTHMVRLTSNVVPRGKIIPTNEKIEFYRPLLLVKRISVEKKKQQVTLQALIDFSYYSL